MKKWEMIALALEVTYGVYVDWKERFFNCPECGEPIYEDDWIDDDLICCPVCDFAWEV